MGSQLTITRDKDDVHLYTVATFGTVRLARTPWGDVLIEAPGLPAWTVSRGGRRFHRTWHASEAGRGEVAVLDPKGKRIVCGSRELTFTFNAPGPRRHRPTAVSEAGRLIATFAARTWATKPLPFEVMDEQAARCEPRLLLFAAWSAEYLHVSVGVAAMPG
jgi:hypothetical protein